MSNATQLESPSRLLLMLAMYTLALMNGSRPVSAGAVQLKASLSQAEPTCLLGKRASALRRM